MSTVRGAQLRRCVGGQTSAMCVCVCVRGDLHLMIGTNTPLVHRGIVTDAPPEPELQPDKEERPRYRGLFCVPTDLLGGTEQTRDIGKFFPLPPRSSFSLLMHSFHR